MNSMRWTFYFSWMLAGLVLSAGCAHPPLDLHLAQERVVAYHDDGRYDRDLARQIKPAYALLEKAAARATAAAQKPALVLDIDETSLSNWAEMKRSEFCYDPEDWNDWVEKREATAIKPTLELYRHARKLGVAVFFITGRKDFQREHTEANLRAMGYEDYAGLVCKPAAASGLPAAEYKSAERAKIEAQGYRIILNIGDQLSDLEGGHAESTIKLVNPYYYIP